MTEAPTIERRADAARRAIPCICPRQHEAKPPLGVFVGFTFIRGQLADRVRCSACARTWKRMRG